MPRAPKEHKNVNIKMELELEKRLSEFCEKKGHSKTWVIEAAVREFLEKNSK